MKFKKFIIQSKCKPSPIGFKHTLVNFFTEANFTVVDITSKDNCIYVELYGSKENFKTLTAIFNQQFSSELSIKRSWLWF